MVNKNNTRRREHSDVALISLIAMTITVITMISGRHRRQVRRAGGDESGAILEDPDLPPRRRTTARATRDGSWGEHNSGKGRGGREGHEGRRWRARQGRVGTARRLGKNGGKNPRQCARARTPVRRPRAHRRVDIARTRGIVIDADTRRPANRHPTRHHSSIITQASSSSSSLSDVIRDHGRENSNLRTIERPRFPIDAPRFSESHDAINSNLSIGRMRLVVHANARKIQPLESKEKLTGMWKKFPSWAFGWFEFEWNDISITSMKTPSGCG